MGDLFTALVELEDGSVDAAREEGRRLGTAKGWEEGYHFGITNGLEIGMEIGFYTSSVDIWKKLNPTVAGSKRFQRLEVNLIKLVGSLEDMKAGNEEYDTTLTQLRNTYELICRVLKVKQEFRPGQEDPNQAQQEMF
eukprot:m.71387 g.71387  ORF g.71387 m.71387 type:complete len:137 (+) comp8346_c0_seq1:132-542(+)